MPRRAAHQYTEQNNGSCTVIASRVARIDWTETDQGMWINARQATDDRQNN